MRYWWKWRRAREQKLPAPPPAPPPAASEARPATLRIEELEERITVDVIAAPP